ncbi:MAG: DNA mismatch repair endonuclease MutL [Pirellulales bacterium]|nr:DNA mismatch repair endonuclease MutL [Pirellulales bacterium]
MPIRQLSQSLINKIAAGEVIERPASVVKELMENAVDAGATRIDVSVTGGGGELVRVVDNGCGIPPEELPLAVASHATSKIAEADDLFRVGTLGFRGEALASVAEVSRLILRSRTADGPGGAEIEVVGGKASDVAPCGCPVGTSVEVHNLFFNTPVRRKFLRTTQTEFGHVSEAFTRIALGVPHVHFTLRHNNRQVFDLAASDGWLERIAESFGRELAEHLIPVESIDGDVCLSGYVANPTHSRSNNRMQYVFLNGRHIRDRALQHALGEAYRGLLTTGRYPVAFLRLQMPSEAVDVNVHPTKLEVRFVDSGRLYSQLLSTLRSKFLTTDLTVRVESPGDDPTGGHDRVRTAELRQELVDWAKGKVASWDAPTRAGSEPAFRAACGLGQSVQSRESLQLSRVDRGGTGRESDEVQAHSTEPPTTAAPAEQPPTANALAARSAPALQIHNRYLVTETEEGVTIIDQHALHERILYEHLRERVMSGALETQSLLVPEPVDLSAPEAAAALEHREVLAQLGMRIEPFGGNTVLVAGYPAMLANINPAAVLHELLERLLSGGRRLDRGDLLDQLLHAIACQAAIKAGDRLSPEEIDTLLKQRHLIDDPHHCPHGRPTALIFTREELDRQFKRV